MSRVPLWRLASRLEQWLPLAQHDTPSLRKYHALRKQSMFLLWEKQALPNWGLKRKIHFYLKLILPGLGQAIRKMLAK